MILFLHTHVSRIINHRKKQGWIPDTSRDKEIVCRLLEQRALVHSVILTRYASVMYGVIYMNRGRKYKNGKPWCWRDFCQLWSQEHVLAYLIVIVAILDINIRYYRFIIHYVKSIMSYSKNITKQHYLYLQDPVYITTKSLSLLGFHIIRFMHPDLFKSPFQSLNLSHMFPTRP